jgi:putative ABC transport system permease protein
MILTGRMVYEGAAVALDSMRTHKLRSALTVLGVVIGVGTVMLMASLVDGIKSSIFATVENSSPRTFYVMRFFSAVPMNPDNLPLEVRIRPILDEDDARALRLSPQIAHAGLWIEFRGMRMEYQGIRSQGLITYGADNSYLEVMGGTLLRGRLFSQAELTSGNNVMVIEEEVADLLFGTLDPIGKVVRYGSRPFTVIGIYQKPDNVFSPPGASYGGVIPFRAGDQQFEYDQTNQLFVAVLGQRGVSVALAQDAATAALRAARGHRPGEPNSFDIITQDQLLDIMDQLTSAFFLVMIALSSVALLVGGIGVMAIMMVSVTDRTREIGIRKAMGATRGEILFQFLIEAATLTCVGGLLGLVVGLGGGTLLQQLLGLSAGVPIWSGVVAISVSVGIGLVFGMLPAMKAARMDPVEALRYE